MPSSTLSEPLLPRDAWITGCNFPAKRDSEVLDQVFEMVRRSPREVGQSRPVVVFDLDSTLYNVQPRTFHILRDWVIEATHIDRPIRDRLLQIGETGVGYTLRDTFKEAGLDVSHPEVEPIWRDLKAFWLEHFFSNSYLSYDTPYPGAADYVWQVHNEGAEVVYLTGRDKPGMAAVTLENLHRDGFPIAIERTHLFMKPGRKGDDLAHKMEMARQISAIGPVVASFENEPRNVAGLCEIYPNAMHVFVETVCSDHPAPAKRGLYRIRGFRN